MSSSHAKITEVTNLSAFKEYTANGVVVVDFYATWCGPCKQLEPIFANLVEKFSNVNFLKVDVDQAGDVAQEFAITAMPTILFFKNGEQVDKIVGANPGLLLQKTKYYSEGAN